MSIIKKLLFLLLSIVVNISGNAMTKEAVWNFDNWPDTTYVSEASLPDNLIIYATNKSANLLSIKNRNIEGSDKYAELTINNSYLIMYLHAGTLKFDIGGSYAVSAEFREAIENDGVWTSSATNLQRLSGTPKQNAWATVEYKIEDDGWYTIRTRSMSSQILMLDNIVNTYESDSYNIPLKVYLMNEVGEIIDGASLSYDGISMYEVEPGLFVSSLDSDDYAEKLVTLSVEADGYKIFGDTNVALGDDETVISLLAVREKSYTVSGTVINEWQSMVEGLTVELLYDGTPVDDAVLTDENGEFELHYTPVHFTPKDVSEFSDAEEDAEDGAVKMYAYAEADDDMHEGYQLRLSNGDIYKPKLIDIAAPVAGETQSQLDDTIQMESGTITTVKSTDVINVTINGRPYHVPEAVFIVNAQGIIVAKIVRNAEITLSPGLYLAAGKKLIVR